MFGYVFFFSFFLSGLQYFLLKSYILMHIFLGLKFEKYLKKVHFSFVYGKKNIVSQSVQFLEIGQ